MSNCGSGIPALFDWQSLAVSRRRPTSNEFASRALTLFSRQLYQEALSVFKWTLPEAWSKNYFLYCLYSWGFIAVVNTDKFGVIPQGCGLQGYDIFYQPTHAVISNPLLRGILRPRIGTECTLIQLQPDYQGIDDIVFHYASQLALVWESVQMNLQNSKLAYVFASKNKTGAETLKALFDRIQGGEPAVFVDKQLFDEAGNEAWVKFDNAIKSNYIVGDLLSDMRKIINEFHTVIGIPNANTDKRERLITDEVNANNIETYSRAELWMDELKKGVEETNKMFGAALTVEWRHPPMERSVKDEQPGDNEPNRAV